jgi:hypothetical protein
VERLLDRNAQEDDDSGTDDSESRGLARVWSAPVAFGARLIQVVRGGSAAEPPASEEGALLASLMPLLHGETALAALPFGLLVH